MFAGRSIAGRAKCWRLSAACPRWTGRKRPNICGRPDFRPRLAEWVADFALAGQAALEGPDAASRMVMFRLYYLGLAPYENARHFLGLSEQSWVIWSEEVRRRCGKELLRRGMFPPRKYFSNAV